MKENNSIYFTNGKKEKFLRAGTFLNVFVVFGFLVGTYFLLVSLVDTGLHIFVGIAVFLWFSFFLIVLYLTFIVEVNFDSGKFHIMTPLKLHTFYYHEINNIRLRIVNVGRDLDLIIKFKDGKQRSFHTGLMTGYKSSIGDLKESEAYLREMFDKYLV